MVETFMSSVEENIQKAKDALPNVTPTPPDLKPQASAQELKARLEWGEPGLTIVDVRSREAYNQGRIMGAIPMPMDTLADRAKESLEPNRDIYVYGQTDQDAAEAAKSLREAGFQKVAELKGGLSDWKAIGGSTEGIVESQNLPGAEGYNVASQIKNSNETQQRADQQQMNK